MKTTTRTVVHLTVASTAVILALGLLTWWDWRLGLAAGLLVVAEVAYTELP